MSNIEPPKIPVWFWVIAGVALVWNLMGVAAFFAENGKTAEDLAAMAEAERQLYETYPVWAKIAFAAAVFGGAIGSALLLARKQLAVPVFAVSLAGISIQMIHSFFIANSMAVYGPSAMIMPIMVILIGVFLLWFSKNSAGKNWLS
ncbi:MAG: hypothetical protein HKN14_00950 [Marinicaulis sp.]|nr:hypothetical protein [Marinicaulis sp.]